MDQIQNNSSANTTNNSSSNSPTTSAARQRQLQLQHHLQQQRLLVQQQQQQLYNLLPQVQASSYSPHAVLPPIPTAPSSSFQSQYFTENLHSPTHTSPPTSASVNIPSGWPSSHHRTSNSREELYPAQQEQRQYQQEQRQYEQEQHQYDLQQQQQREQELQREQQQQQQQQFKREREEAMSYVKEDKSNAGLSSSSQTPHRTSEDPMPSTSDFVKKLYKMLEDPSFQSVVCWGPQGDCFVVKDMNEFTKSILPRMFKHSNFASFVRQLNKYDFHKVKNTDENQFGEHSWTFRHPDFHADRRDALENIKRKVPAQRKNAANAASGGPLQTNGSSSSLPPYASQSSASTSLPYPISSNTTAPPRQRSPSPSNAHLTAEVQRLKEESEDLRARIRNLERNYENVLVEMVGFQRGMAQQDGLMQNLIAYFLGSESGKQKASSMSSVANSNSNVAMSPQIAMSGSDAMSGSRGPQASGSGSSSAPGSSNAAAHQLLKQQIQAHLQKQQGQTSPAASQFLPSSLPTSPMSRIASRSQSISAKRDEPQSYASTVDQQSGVGLWSGMNYTAAGGAEGSSSTSGQTQEGQAAQQKLSRADALAQIRDLHRERLNQGGWSNAPQPPSGISMSGMDVSSGLEALDRMRPQADPRPQSLGRTGGFAEESESEKNIQRAFSTRGRLSMEEDERERGRQMPRRRGSDSSAFLRSGSFSMNDQGAGNPTSSQDEYALSSLSQSQPQPHAQSLPQPPISQTEERQQGPDRAPTQSPWSMMMSMPGFNNPASASTSEGANVDLSQEGLQVYTVGHLLPRDSFAEDAQGNWSFDAAGFSPSTLLGGLGGAGSSAGPSGSGGNARRSTSTEGESDSPTQEFGDEEEVVRPTPSNAFLASSSSSSSGPSSSSLGSAVADAPTPGGSQKLRVRRSTFVPGWAVPPRVLLVDDDAISRKLSSKFLKVFGCTIDVAVDGIGAVNKMNLEKYDLVLMDIVMPKLDGVSATNLIRKFDQGTPIISMTSNSKPNEIMTYYSSGMNDILPKPFTKEGLLEMLEKHLMHLKVIQQMSKVPRSVGVPPLSDPNFEQALAMSATNFMQLQQGSSSSSSTPRPVAGAIAPSLDILASSKGSTSDAPLNAPSPFNFQFFGDGSDDDSRVNPLAGMGLTDEQYNLILQNIVNGEGFMGMMDASGPSNSELAGPSSSGTVGMSEKRPLEDGEDDRRGKRSRFEVIE